MENRTPVLGAPQSLINEENKKCTALCIQNTKSAQQHKHEIINNSGKTVKSITIDMYCSCYIYQSRSIKSDPKRDDYFEFSMK